MIARHWTGIARGESAADYIHHLETETFPSLANIDGFIAASILKRTVERGIEFLIVTYWTSLEAISAFAGDDPEAAVVPPVVQSWMIEYDGTVRHYEVMAEYRPSRKA